MQGLAQARLIKRMASLPRHEDIACPACGASPPAGPFWGCSCGARFDTFDHAGICPRCGKPFETTTCPDCGRQFPYAQWTRGVVPNAFPVLQAQVPAPAPPPSPASFDSSKFFP
jgi:DNA-directed RNA polymerase subunit RPC12/RpoP